MKLVGAPFPPRPKAIATFLSSSDFLKGCQTLLYSAKRHLAPTPDDEYPPEIIVLLSSKVPNAAAKRKLLHPAFCDRIVHVEHIPISKDPNETSDGTKRSHVKSWDENCGWTKLRLFELDSYDTILYIDADCLVLKDVSHLLRLGDRKEHVGRDDGAAGKRVGLLAAAPDLFPPDKFNAGVLVVRPSRAVFDDMLSRLPHHAGGPAGAGGGLRSYDGGDTGFLNAYYPGWYAAMPASSRLPFGCNAQRLMHHCTHVKRPQYWDDAIKDLAIVHYSSSPKPWEALSEPHDEAPRPPAYLDEKDASHVRAARQGKLEEMWMDTYKQSQRYAASEEKKAGEEEEAAAARRAAERAPAAKRPPRPAGRAAGATPDQLARRRYKELRKNGVATKRAMRQAREEYGLDRQDDTNPSRAVGQMFGLA